MLGSSPSRLLPLQLALFVLVLAAAAAAQNSLRKIRPEPGPVAARIGSAVVWRSDPDAAVAEARATGRPVFWYVPTVPGSPMDRQVEIDRYMLAGPFSWPGVVAVLNERFVPLRAIPSAAAADRHDLRPHRFIEPGYLVLDGDGSERCREDRIATLVPAWWRQRLAAALAVPVADLPAASPLEQAFVGRDFDRIVELTADADADADAAAAGADLAESLFWRGAALFRLRDFAAARAAWQRLAAAAPQAPLAFKVAAELEGHGPFLHGFEEHVAVPEAILAGERTYDAAALRQRSVRFLLDQQGADGGYHDSRYDFGGSDSVANVHVAVTALVGWALLATRAAVPGLRAELDEAWARIVAHCLVADHCNHDDRDELVWAHAYRLRLWCAWAAADPAAAAAVRPAAEQAVTALLAMQEHSGAWFHEYGNPFVIATVLLALADARTAGLDVADDAVARGTRALLQCRAENGAYTYGFVSRPRSVAVAAAAGRMPLCEHALRRWGKADEAAVAAALEAAFTHHDLLAAVRRYDDHADRYGYGGFFFWYDMRARSEAIAGLTDQVLRARLLRRQLASVLSVAEFDGCFVDSHELGRCYGTAMALLCLAMLEER